MDLKDSDIDCNTKNNVKRASFVRTIDNFSFFGLLFGECGRYDFSNNSQCKCDNLCQQCYEQKLSTRDRYTFNFEVDSKVKCSLGIYPNGLDAESNGYASLFLQFEELSCLKITALCRFSILNANGIEEYKSVVGIEKFDANKNSYRLRRFIDKKDFLDKKSIILPNDRLTVCYEIFYFCDDAKTSGVSETISIDKDLEVFLKDMNRMLDLPEFYDCIIKIGDSEIKAHKCIIATRSEVFRSTLKKKLTESQLSIIEINDFRLEVVTEMMNYLYTGRSSRMDEVAIEMLELAEKYKLEGLKLVATDSLLKSLHVENVCEYLEKSELYSAEILKEFCLRYIYLNAQEVVKRVKWRKIVNFYPLLLERIVDIAVHID